MAKDRELAQANKVITSLNRRKTIAIKDLADAEADAAEKEAH